MLTCTGGSRPHKNNAKGVNYLQDFNMVKTQSGPQTGWIS